MHDDTLTRTLINLFEFLFKQILSQVILVDSQGGEGGAGDQAAQGNKGAAVSFSSSQKLIS